MLSTLFIGFGVGVAPMFSFNYDSANVIGKKGVPYQHGLYFCGMTCHFCPFAIWWFCYYCAICKTRLNGFSLHNKGFSHLCLFISVLWLQYLCIIHVYSPVQWKGVGCTVVSSNAWICNNRTPTPAKVFGVLDIWLAVPLTKCIMVFLSAGCLLKYRKQYGCLNWGATIIT